MMNEESMLWRAIRNPRQAKNLLLYKLLSWIFKDKEFPKGETPLLRLQDYAFVFTDTYHCAINSIVNGPVVYCISDNSIIYNKRSHDLHDGKKEVLYRDMGVEDQILRPGKWNIRDLKNLYPVNYFVHVKNVKTKLEKVCRSILNG